MSTLQPLNHLLASMAAGDMARWAPLLVRADLIHGQVLHEPGEAPADVYFPETALVSLQHVLPGGVAAEVALVGRDGLVGLASVMQDGAKPCRAVVRSAGMAWRLAARELRAELMRGREVLHLLLRYTQALTVQMAQTALCKSHHAPDQQLCRWLLVGLDLTGSNTLGSFEAAAAPIQGLSADQVQGAFQRLRATGAIDSQPDSITVLRRDLLERAVCECHGVIQAETDRLLP
jgi:CRP-like cAMP-binding protein